MEGEEKGREIMPKIFSKPSKVEARRESFTHINC